MNGEMPTPQNPIPIAEQPVQDSSSFSPNENPKQKKGLLKALALLEVGIIEVLLAGIVIVLLFGTLNYFNILPISQLWTNQFGFLPHRASQTNIPPKLNSLKPTPVFNYSPNVFQYDSEKAKTIFTSYIRDTIKPEMLPSQIETTEGGSPDELDLKLKTTDGSNVSALFHYNKNSNTLSDLSIFIEPKNVKGKIATTSLANTLSSSYFINPLTISTCDTKGLDPYCEKFQDEEKGKRGFAIISSQYRTLSSFFVATCFIPKESQYYKIRTSCLRQSQ